MKFAEMTDEELLETIMRCAQELGWNVAIPTGEEEEAVAGIILGTQEYLDMIVSHLDEAPSSSSKVTH